MSAGELVALIQGLFNSRRPERMELPPDNTCCICLTLRSGSIIIGIANCLLYLGMLTWYLTSPNIDTGGVRDGLNITSLDISVFSIFSVQVLINLLLLVGSVKKIPSHLLPWLCANAVCLVIAMICIVITILFGTTKLSLNYEEYVASLTTLGIFTAVSLFCWIVVFTFRKNLVLETQISLLVPPSSPAITPRCPASAPPPSYYETEGYKECKPPPEDPPPEYEEAVAMIDKGEKVVKGPVVQRKKSLTHNAV